MPELFGDVLSGSVNWLNLLVCTAVALALGLLIAFTYMYKNTYSKGFVATLVLLPVIVQAVILLVNGNLGTGVAVLGAFSLIRFRSVPGGARDIGSIFCAMAVGLATAMGYCVYAAVFTAIVCAAMLILFNSRFGKTKQSQKMLKVTIPESLDYTNLFDDLFDKYTKTSELVKVKTTNMGSLYELSYDIVLKNTDNEREFIDEIRCRNGNLNIICGRVNSIREEL